jgi:mono/diheme cytochrome c family protein
MALCAGLAAGPLPAEHPGKRPYDRYCGGCHGDKGDGHGPAAIFLNPKPRDFTTGKFKFAAVPSGQLPTDPDLHRTLIHGLKGSSMPAWPLVPEQERKAMIDYLKTFSPRWQEASPGVAIPVAEDPYRGDPAEIKKAIARGEIVYHAVTTCWQCHPGYVTPERFAEIYTALKRKAPPVREGFDKPVLKPDGWGQPLMPTEFKSDRIKTGLEMNNLFLVIAAGIGGTAMPSWKDSIPDEDIWALAYYVRSLADERNAKLRTVPLAPPATLTAQTGGQ